MIYSHIILKTTQKAPLGTMTYICFSTFSVYRVNVLRLFLVT